MLKTEKKDGTKAGDQTMRLTKTRLREIILEEYNAMIESAGFDLDTIGSYPPPAGGPSSAAADAMNTHRAERDAPPGEEDTSGLLRKALGAMKTAYDAIMDPTKNMSEEEAKDFLAIMNNIRQAEADHSDMTGIRESKAPKKKTAPLKTKKRRSKNKRKQ